MTDEPVVVLPMDDARELSRLAATCQDLDLPEARARARLDALIRLARPGVDPLRDRVQPGTIVVLRENRDADEEDEAFDLRVGGLIEEVKRISGHTQWTLLLLGRDESIELLDEEAMRTLGWVRLEP